MLNFTNGIVLLLSVVKHQSEFDTKVKFPELRDAIGQINTAMGDYNGNAKHNVDTAMRINENARSIYQQSVAPVFDWCGEAIEKFNTALPQIRSENLSTEDKDLIWQVTVTTVNDGLEKSFHSLELLNDVQNNSSNVMNLLSTILHDTYDDFGPSGYYGKMKNDAQNKINDLEQTLKKHLQIGFIPFGNIGSAVIVKEYVKQINEWKNKKLDIESKFDRIIPKIQHASQVAKMCVNPYLEEDKTNLVTLRGKAGAVDNNNPLLTLDSPTIRATFIPVLQDLITQCHKYTIWHGLQH
ncbi:uncharacterized protein Dana_GF26568, isoform B [Drosophila ananassae]|uniref:Uncharacterized protein, isoform B n=1 Tax=Drosophila ananassae TaxID=7217 RepID=A0A0P8Y2N0_DROAN|nr:uncharacterized protein LOC26513977 isoform X1 [Drosophila ananassae]KPU72874.1 uncharacterized protein Dana_GF26568, isoform B [Drosophila ananassae]